MPGKPNSVTWLMKYIVKQPAQSTKMMDIGVRLIQGSTRQARIYSITKEDFANMLEAFKSPRQKAFAAVDRLLMLEMLESDIAILKENSTAKFYRGGVGPSGAIGPSNWALGHVGSMFLMATDIQANLRRLADIDGVDAAIYSDLGLHYARAQERIINAAMAKDKAPSGFSKVEDFLVYSENRVVRHVLERVVRRYARNSTPFNFSRAMGDLVAELALNHMKSITRVRELTALYDSGDSRSLTAYYEALYAKINSSN